MPNLILCPKLFVELEVPPPNATYLLYLDKSMYQEQGCYCDAINDVIDVVAYA